jgi:hypothetical protein
MLYRLQKLYNVDQVKGMIIYNALNRIWCISRYFPHIYVEGLRQTKDPVSLCQENQCPVFEIGMPAY